MCFKNIFLINLGFVIPMYSMMLPIQSLSLFTTKKRVYAEGGIVSAADEVMIFLKAFFNGYFFAKENITELKKWNLLLPPPGLFYFGVGLEKIPTPRIMQLTKPVSEIIGFWDQSGSFAWYNSDTDLYFSGTTNQVDGSGHRAAMRAILKIINSVL